MLKLWKTGFIMLQTLFDNAYERHKHYVFIGHAYWFYPLQAMYFLIMLAQYVVKVVNRHTLAAAALISIR